MGGQRVMFEDQIPRVPVTSEREAESQIQWLFLFANVWPWRSSHWSLPMGSGPLSAVPQEVLRLDGALVALPHPSGALSQWSRPRLCGYL